MPCNDQPSASTAARPPSVVALPPAATITCLKPSRRATAISSPVPRVLARSGSLRPDTSAKPLARAISTIAIPPGRTPHSASTGSPRGPVTRATRANRRAPRATCRACPHRRRRVAIPRCRRSPLAGARPRSRPPPRRPATCRGTCRGTQPLEHSKPTTRRIDLPFTRPLSPQEPLCSNACHCSRSTSTISTA